MAGRQRMDHIPLRTAHSTAGNATHAGGIPGAASKAATPAKNENEYNMTLAFTQMCRTFCYSPGPACPAACSKK
jgi:hypothetical protein